MPDSIRDVIHWPQPSQILPGWPGVTVDTREQHPLSLPAWAMAQPGTLQSGDYAVRGLNHLWTIERKTGTSPGGKPGDFWSSIGRDRARFGREIDRLAGHMAAFLLIEGDGWQDLAAPPAGTSISGRVAVRSVLEYCATAGVIPVIIPRRLAGEFVAYTLYALWRDFFFGRGYLDRFTKTETTSTRATAAENNSVETS